MTRRKATKAWTPSSKCLKRLRLTHKANDKHDASNDIAPDVDSLLPDFSTTESLSKFISSSNYIIDDYTDKKTFSAFLHYKKVRATENQRN